MLRTFDNILYASLLLLGIIALSSCNFEKKFAREFIKNDSTRTAMVIPPDYLFKTSLKQDEAEEYSNYNWDQIDSLLYENSLFLRNISDSVFIENYYSAFCTELEHFGYTVYNPDSIILFLSGNPDAFIFNLAQLEIEEYIKQVLEEEEVNGQIRSKLIDLNGINVNSWIEISSLNEDENNELIFSSLFLLEEEVGVFRINYFKNELKYLSLRDSLYVNEINQMASLSGYIYACNTFNYFMNQYIDKRMMEADKWRSDMYYYYNRKGRYLTTAKGGRQYSPMDER
jgi:hypothetical protein